MPERDVVPGLQPAPSQKLSPSQKLPSCSERGRVIGHPAPLFLFKMEADRTRCAPLRVLQVLASRLGQLVSGPHQFHGQTGDRAELGPYSQRQQHSAAGPQRLSQ